MKIRQTAGMFVWMLLLLGLIYPLFITGIVHLLMPMKAGGSLITSNGKIIGSKLVGQKFESDKYFWPRPSAVDYNPLPSGGSNLGPTSAVLKNLVKERKDVLIKMHEGMHASQVPSELLFASGSGLDPHISVRAALFQLNRVAKARGLDENGKQALHDLVIRIKEGRTLGFLGEPRLNVLELNKALDEMP